MRHRSWGGSAAAIGMVFVGASVFVIHGATAGEPGDGAPESDAVHVHYGFDDGEHGLDGVVVSAAGEAAKRMPNPKLYDGKLYLLESWWKSSARAEFPKPTEELMGKIDISASLIMNTGTEGAGFLWLADGESTDKSGVPDPTAATGIPGDPKDEKGDHDAETRKDASAETIGLVPDEFEAWEEPSIARSFSVGFDARDLPNRDPFRGSGNIYDRPQHEVSLHWDGVEIVKKMTETEFRDEEPHTVHITVEFVIGGADVTLKIDDEMVFADYFIPSMVAYVGRPVFGARNRETAGDVMLDDLDITCSNTIEPFGEAKSFVGIDHKINDGKHGTNEAEVSFPENTDEFGRIILTLRLDKPETRFDPWDRIAHVFTFDDDGERIELLRYITPYHRGFVWKVDVSDFRSVLTGKRKIVQQCGTQGEGWVVTVSFDFYLGEAERYAYKIIKLWSGSPEIGNPDKPVGEFYVPREVEVGDKVPMAAKVRMVVTGHGMSPNTGNAGEFMPIWRTLRVNGSEFRNRLWKTDNYLNPCRPQGGTWKYDRAGWAPGDIVRPWEVAITPEMVKSAKGQLQIEYQLNDYVNEGRGKTWAPSHVTEGYLVLYRGVSE